MFDSIKKAVGPKIGLAGLTIKEHAPEIYLGAGIAAGVGAVIMTAKAHKKSDEVFANVSENIETVRDHVYVNNDDPKAEEITPAEERRMLAPIYVESARRAGILYGPGILMGITSVALILASHGVIKGRNRSLIATVGLLERGFSTYRSRVVAELGEEADERFYYGGYSRKTTTLEVDENGKKKKIKGTENHIPEEVSPIIYQRVFEEFSNVNWSPDEDMSEYFLRAVEQQMNDILHIKGYLMLNTVYKSLGYGDSPEGAVVGWSQKVRGDDHVSFGLEKDINQREGDNRWILDFNVNGVVYDRIGER